MFQLLKVIPKAVIVLIFCFFISALVSDAQAQLFAPKVDYTVGLRPYHLVSADFDNDGDFDLVTGAIVGGVEPEFVIDGLDTVCVLMNNGDGTFAAPVKFSLGDAPSFAAADLDKDSDIDLAAADIFTNRIYILLNDGAGAFTVVDSFASGGISPHGLCAPDLDGDGDFDLAVPNSDFFNLIASDSISIFFNNGDTTFTGPVNYPMGIRPHTAISSDLDLDGDSDLVVTNNGSASVSVLLNNGNGTFAPRVDYAVRLNPQSPSLADYNGDGRLDLAVPNSNPSTPFVSLLKGNGDGTFQPKVDWPGCRPHAVASADYDVDGDIDMAVTNNECNSVSIFLNNGNGTFAPHFQLAAVIGTQHIVAKDFDADCLIDLAVSNFDSDGTAGNNVSVFLNLSVNQAPVLDPLSPETLSENDSISLRVHFADPSICQLSLACTNLPLNASFLDSGNTAGSFTFSPNTSQAGNYNIIFIASDGILSDTDSVAITVLDCINKPGDVDGNKSWSLTDIVGEVNIVFKGAAKPTPLCRTDCNGSGGNPNLTDIVCLVNKVFKGGANPIKIGVCCL